MTTDARHHKGRKRVNLALQGGGAHGAFTWGVLERLISRCAFAGPWTTMKK